MRWCLRVNDRQISFFCMNVGEARIKVHGPEPASLIPGPVRVKSYTLTHSALSGLGQAFTTLHTHPLDVGAALSTPPSPDAGLIGPSGPPSQSEGSSWVRRGPTRAYGRAGAMETSCSSDGDGWGSVEGAGAVYTLSWCGAGVLWSVKLQQWVHGV